MKWTIEKYLVISLFSLMNLDKKIRLTTEMLNAKIMDEKQKLETYLLFQIDQLNQRLDEVLNRVNLLSLKLDSVIDDLANMKGNVDDINSSLDNLH